MTAASGSSSLNTFTVLSMIVAVVSISWMLTPAKVSKRATSLEVMCIYADHDWSAGTTNLPISRTSIVAKQVLSRDYSRIKSSALKLNADTIPLKLIRDYLNEERSQKLMRLCPDRSACDLETPDIEFGLTPLHVAHLFGDHKSVNYIMKLLGPVSLAPFRLDSAGRMPSNLSFVNFIANSQRSFKGRSCQIPQVSVGNSEGLREFKRLVHEGEPVIARGFLQNFFPEVLGWSIEDFRAKHGSVNVTVGSVPYASYFGLPVHKSTLEEYLAIPEPHAYVFAKDKSITGNILQVLNRFMRSALPEYIMQGFPADIHFYIGSPGSGAPFHIHCDAINLMVSGQKLWRVQPPSQSLYSRSPVDEFIDDQSYPSLSCIQNPGDLMFVPFDWGHSVLNSGENHTFGFALELLNRRDSLYFLKNQ